MKRFRWWFLGTFVVVTALLVGVTLRARQNPLYQLSHYPRTPAFKSYVFDVSSELKNPDTDSLVNISETRNGEFENVLEYKVKPDGQFDLNIRGFAVGFGGQGRTAALNSQQFAEVKKLVGQLPPSAPPLKREDLFVVLIYKPLPTQLRLYDHRNPPPQIREIVGILTGIVEKQDQRIPAEQQPTALFPHLQSSLRPNSSNPQTLQN